MKLTGPACTGALSGLTVKRLLEKLRMDWPEQRRVLGFEAKVLAS